MDKKLVTFAKRRSQMIEEKELKSIEHLDLLATKIVEGYLIGLHKSPFHGFSAEFREHRIYNEGEPLKNIDYKVLARTDKMYVKKYDEETNLKCQLVLDISPSMYYPKEGSRSKIDFSIVAIASLMKLLKKQRDAFGLTLFSDKVYDNIPPKLNEKTKQHIYSMLHQYFNFPKSSQESNISNSIHQLAHTLKSRSLVVIFSDLMESQTVENQNFYDNFIESLQHILFNKHEIIFFHVLKKTSEIDFDFENKPMEIIDVETNQTIKLTSNAIRESYQNTMIQNNEIIKNKCIQIGVDYVPVDIDSDYEWILHNFLRKRKKLF